MGLAHAAHGWHPTNTRDSVKRPDHLLTPSPLVVLPASSLTCRKRLGFGIHLHGHGETKTSLRADRRNENQVMEASLFSAEPEHCQQRIQHVHSCSVRIEALHDRIPTGMRLSVALGLRQERRQAPVEPYLQCS